MHVTFKWCRWPTYIERQYPGATGLNKSNGLNKQQLSAKIEKEYFRVNRNPTVRKNLITLELMPKFDQIC